MRRLSLIALMLLPMLSYGADRWTALSMLESGDNDRAVGKAGEISRYQILKQEWKTVTPSRRYTDPVLAKVVAEELMKRRMSAFAQIYKREPSDYEFYVLWNAPGQVLNRQVTRTVAERAKRYRNLCEAFSSQPVRLYAAR
jgi:hypothetical protein